MATITGTNSIDSLLAGRFYRWNFGSDFGTSVSVTYSFMESVPSYADADDSRGFTALSETARAYTRQALATWTRLTGLTLTEVSDSGDGGQIRIGSNVQSGSAGYAYYAGTSVPTSGDIYMDVDYTTDAMMTPGGYGFLAMIHEIGHALGLKHPGDYDAQDGDTETPYLPESEDNYAYTLMSYNEWDLSGYPTSPQLYDVAAIQYLYGINTGTNGGDTLYTNDSSVSIQVIVDGGGTDTLSGAGSSAAQVLNLNGNTFSSLGGGTDNAAVTANAMIENAFGGDGNDILRGNDLANALVGGDGDDTIVGGAGDTIYGGNGTDRVFLEGAGGSLAMAAVEILVGSSGVDTILLGNEARTLSISGIEALVGGAGGEWINMADAGSVYLGAIDTLIGSAGADSVSLADAGNTIILAAIETLTGGGGTDRIRLGDRGGTITISGLEVLFGGAGADWVNLGNGGTTTTMVGVETLIGGTGGDWVRLGDRGNTTILVGIESLGGGDGGDFIRLGDRGSTMIVNRLDTVIGGAGNDSLTLSGPGSMVIAGIETVTGSTGTDSLRLGDRGNILTISGIETVTLGDGTDVVTLAAGDSTTVTLGSVNAGSDPGSASGANAIAGFAAGTDKVAIATTLRTLVDTDGGGITVSTRALGETRASDDVVLLTETVSSFTDTDFGTFRSALGPVESGSTVIVAAQNGTSTALFFVSDGGDGSVTAGEVRLLTTIDAILTASDFSG